jgi:hypothetical protein
MTDLTLPDRRISSALLSFQFGIPVFGETKAAPTVLASPPPPGITETVLGSGATPPTSSAAPLTSASPAPEAPAQPEPANLGIAIQAEGDAQSVRLTLSSDLVEDSSVYKSYLKELGDFLVRHSDEWKEAHVQGKSGVTGKLRQAVSARGVPGRKLGFSREASGKSSYDIRIHFKGVTEPAVFARMIERVNVYAVRTASEIPRSKKTGKPIKLQTHLPTERKSSDN